MLHEIFDEAEAELKKITKDKKQYKPVLVGLIEEGVLALMEPKVSIKVREQDVDVAKEAITEAAKNFEEKAKFKVEISIDDKNF